MGGAFRGRRESSADAVGFERGDGTSLKLEQGAGERYDRHTPSMGIHRTARPPLDAADEPLARATLDTLLDDRGNATGRRMAVVFARSDFVGLRWAAEICGGECGGKRRSGWRCRIQAAEET